MSTKRDVVVAESDPKSISSLLTASVVPRPVAWVSTVSAAGHHNLAPHSFFTVASKRPPMLLFTSVGEKDTLLNIRETQEFVISLVPYELVANANATGIDRPADRDQFVEAGIHPEASRLVQPRRVAESPLSMECKLHRIIDAGDSYLVLGEVLCWAVAEDALDPAAARPTPLVEQLRPVARLGTTQWAKLGEVFDLPLRRYRLQ